MGLMLGKGPLVSAGMGFHTLPAKFLSSVHIDLPGWTDHSVEALKARCEELHLQPRGTRGESGGQTGHTYDISNKHRLGYSEVELVQKMIDGVKKLFNKTTGGTIMSTINNTCTSWVIPDIRIICRYHIMVLSTICMAYL